MNGLAHNRTSYPARAALMCITLMIALCAFSATTFAQGKDCSGTFTVTLPDGRSFSGPSVRAVVNVGGGIARVRGKFVSFDVNLSSFQMTNYTLNSNITANRPAVIFQSKTPLHARTLNGSLSIDINSEQMVLQRSDGDLDMKIQAKDCSEGGIFQMEPEADFTGAIEFEHLLGPEFVYCVDTLGRVLIVSTSNPFVGRESPETASRTFPAGNAIVGTKTSRWLVQNGGRMGMVTGEDAVEPLTAPCGANGSPGPTPTPTPGATPSPTPNATPSPSPTPSPTATPSPTPTPGATPSPTPVMTEIEANLVGAAINGIVPRGDAEFSVEPDGLEFRVRIENVNLPAGTVLRVLVDSQFIGNISVAANLRRSELKLKTEDGQTVPQVNPRTRVVVTNQAGDTIVAGSFSNIPNPNPEPGPAPMPTPDNNGRLRIESRLAGAAINGLTPTGRARFRSEPGRRDFNVEVERVNLPAGTLLSVFVDGVKLGEIVLSSTLRGEFERNTNDGQFVPDVTTATSVVVTNPQGQTILSGGFNTTVPAVAPGSNIVDQTTFFVEQQYKDFLGREADDGGLGFWSANIANCNGNAACVERQRINTSAAFFLSIEFQETGYMLYRFNRASYGTMPRRNSFLVDMEAAARGIIVGTAGWQERLEANKRAVADAWVARPEFRAVYDSMSNAQYVDALFGNAGVAPTQGERNALIAGLDGGTETRATVLRSIADHAEFRRKESNPAFVLMQYFGYLQRNPDEGPDTNLDGFNFWLSKLNQFGGDYNRAEMVRAFISSIEYRERFNH